MDSISKIKTILLSAAVLAGGFVFLYLNLFYLNVPIYLHGDNSTYLFNARRMLDGQVIYRDFFQHSMPATEVLYFLLFKILGVRAWIPNAVLIFLGLSLAGLMIIISRKVIPGRAAFLPAALFLVIPFYSQPGAANLWFSILIVLAAIYLLIDHITALGLVGAGFLCGVATCFSMSRGVAAEIGLAAFLVWAVYKKVFTWYDCRRAQVYLWAPFFVIIAGFNAYFAIEGGVGAFLRDTVASGFRYWFSTSWSSFHVYMTDVPQYHPWYHVPDLIVWLAVYLLVPLIYILFFVRYWDEQEDFPDEPWERVMLLLFVGLALFLGVVKAPTWVRLCTISPPAIIVFVWYFCFRGSLQKIRTVGVWVGAIALAIGLTVGRKLEWRAYVSTPIGKVAVLDHVEYEEIHFLLEKTKPGEYFFGNAALGYLLDLRDPARVAYISASDSVRPDQVSNIVESLKSHKVDYVFWSPALDLAQVNTSSPNHLGPLYGYLNSNYHAVKTFPNYDMLWKKGAQPPPQFSTQPIPIPVPTTSEPPQPPGSVPTPAP